jgi:hypothetical protein
MNSPAPSTPTSGAKSRKSRATPAAGDETGCRDYGDGRPQCDPNLTSCVQNLEQALHGLSSDRPPQLANWNGDDDATTSLFDAISEALEAYYPKPGQERPTWCSSPSSSTPAGG